MVNSTARPQIYGYIAGLDGVDVSPEILEGICLEVLNKEAPDDLPVWVRGN
jgi:hypothetical protein